MCQSSAPPGNTFHGDPRSAFGRPPTGGPSPNPGNTFHGDSQSAMGAQPPVAPPVAPPAAPPPQTGVNPYAGQSAQQIMAAQQQAKLGVSSQWDQATAQGIQQGRVTEGLAHPYYSRDQLGAGYDQARTSFMQQNPGMTFDLAQQIRQGGASAPVAPVPGRATDLAARQAAVAAPVVRQPVDTRARVANALMRGRMGPIR